MKQLVFFLSVLMLVASAQAKVLKASDNMTTYKHRDKNIHGTRISKCGVDILVRYNPTTDRGEVGYGQAVHNDDYYGEITVHAYDADGFFISSFSVGYFETYGGTFITNTGLTPEERKQIVSIAVYNGGDPDFWCEESLQCPKGRHEEDGVCARDCDDNHIYNSETDKCDYLYDSKETAELVLDDNGNVPSSPIYTNEYPDQSGEWCQKADGEWYFDNNVKDGKCPKVKVRKDPELESAYGNEPSEKAWDNSASATYDAQYNNASGRWECTQPFHHDGYGHCVM